MRGPRLPPWRRARLPLKTACGAVTSASLVADEGAGDGPDGTQHDGTGHGAQRGITGALRERCRGRE
jgi:hypothetical protein